MFKKIINLIFLFLLVLPSGVGALGLGDAFNTKKDSNLESFNKSGGFYSENTSITPEFYVGILLNLLFSILGLIFIGIMVYNGYVWMTARGNESKVEQAKEGIYSAIIGLLFVVGGYALTTFLLRIFT